MLIITILCVLIGAAVGLRFKVYVLVPATGFVVVSVVLTNIAYSELAGDPGARDSHDGHRASNRVSSGYRYPARD